MTSSRQRSSRPRSDPCGDGGRRAVLLCAVAIGAGCAPPRAPAPAARPQVLVAEVAREEVPIYNEWVGTLDGVSNAQIRPQVTGYLQEIRYQEGAFVKKGDLLFEIDPRPYQAALEQAKSQLAKAQADFGKTELDLQRLRPLAEEKVISQQDLDNAVQADLAAKSEVAAADAAVAQASINLGYTRIAAPIEGLAGMAKAQIGELVGTSVVLTTISTVDPIRALFQASEQQYLNTLTRLRELQAQPIEKRPARAELILGDGSVYEHKGKFEFADRQVDPQTGTLQIVEQFPNPGNVLRPGQFVRVRVLMENRNVLLVPQRAVAELQGTYHVDVVGPGDKVEIRPVQPGERAGSRWIIAAGLAQGERVIVEGIQKVRAGTVVDPQPFVPAEVPGNLRRPETRGPETSEGRNASRSTSPAGR